MNKDNLKSNLKNKVVIAFAVLVLIIAGLSYFGYTQIQNLHTQNLNLRQQLEQIDTRLASTTLALSESIEVTKEALGEELAKEKSNLEQKFGSVQEKVGSLSGSLSNLEKLSKIDEELLQKYSKVSFLNEHYKPVELSLIPKEYTYHEDRNYQIHSKVWPHLKRMIDDAKTAGIELYVKSAFRSFNEQSALKSQYTIIYGAGTANQFSADQGYSEHQLGTTVDVITTGIGGTLEGFGNTEAYKWMLDNAYKYGFVLSYPENNDYYIYEPWHWRFVGIDLAKDLHSVGKNFYEMDQRVINEYLIKLFD